MRLHANAAALFALAGLPALFAGVANAQTAEPVAALDPTVVTASRTAQKLSDTLASTTVISHRQIQDSQAADLPELLRSVAGIEMVQTGGPGSQASIFMRGANSSQVLVLIDGVPVSSATTGLTEIDQIPASQIDHIEIVRGNVSALYGSQAIGGVIQIFTKHGGYHRPRASAELSYGSYDTRRAQIGLSGALDKAGKTQFSLNASTYKTRGFSAIDPAQGAIVNPAPGQGANPNDNGYENRSFSAQLSHRLNADWEVGANWFQTDGTVSFDNAYGLPTDINETDTRVRLLSAYAKGHLTKWWSTRATVSQGNDDNASYLNAQANGDFHTRTRQFDWQNDFALSANQSLQAGYEHQNQDVSASTAYAATTRRVDSVFAGYLGKFGRNQLQLNVRRDVYSDFGGANSYYAGYGFSLTPQWKLLASLSDAFRAPTFNELYYPGYGNANLLPERAHSLEFGVQHSSALGTVRVNVFRTRYSDLINADAQNGYLAGNIDSAEVKGVETIYMGNLAGVDVNLNATLQSPVDNANDTLLPRRARRFARVSLARKIGGVRWGAEWLVSSRRLDGATPYTLGGYGIVNLSARYDINKSWYVAARLDNVFNKAYELAYSYNTTGRAAYVTLGWHPR
ncbi:hypothetical protein PATSB16_07790 [Pandoraea thiooxydans]|uniref:TonB-dependent receptor n=1 Tax=Pandoraea thiooxydans TaxID=445709 RepID=A0A0G3EJF0_9BURK|nr:TonB-dependent receptor [Pandoraea thiooxydans]AKJ67158.1 TonB-dependent receptor [Pandoraea thiooxydans]APR94121.1 hypothetical protein PATSB16_07790 [Pandoraea thiooxydans]